MTSNTTESGSCPACGRTYTLTKTGTIPNHRPNRGPGDYCPGSRELPIGASA